jgi:DNA-binding transcriptional ArsR family regulator
MVDCSDSGAIAGSASEAAALDRTFAALSDPTRRAILARLCAGSATVGELAEPFPISLNAVSKHLRVLERAGLLRREVRGREHHCCLEAGPLQGASEWTQRYRAFWEARLDALAALLEGRRGSEGGP